MKKRVLLTGASGFVGANLARRLLREGHEVHLILRPEHRSWRIEEIKHDVRIHLLDMSDEPRLSRVVAGIRPEWIFHLAAYGAYSHQTEFHRMVEVNFVQTTNLLRACLRQGFEAFVNTGSSSEYGFKSSPPREEDLPEPNSDYAVTKLSATLHCQMMAAKHGARIFTMRLYSVFGPYEEPSRLVPTLLANGLRGGLPPLVAPETARDFVHTEDVCDAFLSVASAEASRGGVFNVGTGVQTSLRDLVTLVKGQMSITAEPKWGSMPGRIWDTSTWVCDNRKLRAETGWTPRTLLAEGLQQTLDWLRHHPDMLARYQKESLCS